MSKRFELRRGDTCPCCGQKIETEDPLALAHIEALALRLERTEKGREYLRAVGFEWPEEDEPC